MQDDLFIRQMTACHIPLKSFLFTLLGNLSAVEDVLQNTHVQMWLKKDTFTEGTNFFAWACRIAHFKVLEHRSTMARERIIFDDALIGTLAADAADYQDRHNEQGVALEECLDALHPRQRELLQERYAGTRTTVELAQRLNRSAASINVTLFRIRKMLLGCIEKKLAVENRQ